MEGVEPSWPRPPWPWPPAAEGRCASRCRYIRKEPPAVKLTGGSSRSSGRPRGQPLGPFPLEARRTAGFERNDPGRAQPLLRACRNPSEAQAHLVHLLRLPRERSDRAEAGARSRGWDSNPRSRAHEAREDSHSSTAQGWTSCLCLSPALRPWIVARPECGRRRPTWRSFGARASRASLKNRKLKPTLILSVLFQRKRRGSFSLGGASI